MKTKITQYVRTSIIVLLGTISFILFIAEPIEEDTWFKLFFISKSLAAIIGYACCRLYKDWESKGLLIDELFGDEHEDCFDEK